MDDDDDDGIDSNASDLSENELFSDDDSGSDVFHLPEQESRDSIAKYTRMYASENHPEEETKSIPSSPSDPSDNKSDCDMDVANEDVNHIIRISTPEETSTFNDDDYPFAPVLPACFNNYSLSELSKLPADVNWRSIVKSSKNTSLSNLGSLSKQNMIDNKNTSWKLVTARKQQQASELTSPTDALVERLLTMERLQLRTTQIEILRKYHRSHHKVNAATSSNSKVNGSKNGNGGGVAGGRPTSAQQPSTSHSRSKSESDSNKQNSSDKEPVPPPASSLAKRRHSSSLAISRVEWANQATQGNNSLLERAMKDGDLTILHNHWLVRRATLMVNNQNENGQNQDPNGASNNSKRNPRSERYRFRVALSKLYKYSWSEKVKVGLPQNYSSLTTRYSSCATCRSMANKMSMNQNYVRPR